jgi:hypothetical protein
VVSYEDGCLLGCSTVPCCLHHQDAETLVNYQTTRRYNPEDSHLRTHRRENLKSYSVVSHFYSTIYDLKIPNIIQSTSEMIKGCTFLIKNYEKCKKII